MIHHESQYKLRGRSLKDTIEEAQRDVNLICEYLEKVSETIDEALGLASRWNSWNFLQTKILAFQKRVLLFFLGMIYI